MMMTMMMDDGMMDWLIDWLINWWMDGWMDGEWWWWWWRRGWGGGGWGWGWGWLIIIIIITLWRGKSTRAAYPAWPKIIQATATWIPRLPIFICKYCQNITHVFCQVAETMNSSEDLRDNFIAVLWLTVCQKSSVQKATAIARKVSHNIWRFP